MKVLIVPIAIIIALIAFFVIIDRKEFSRYDNARTVQSESPATNWKPTGSVPQTQPATGEKSLAEATPVTEAIRAKAKSAETGSAVGSKSAEDNTGKNKPAPAAVPVLTPEEAIKANKEAISYYQDLAAKERIHKFFYQLLSFLKKYSILFVLALIVFVSEFFIGTEPNKVSKNKSPDKESFVQYAVPATLFLFSIMIFIPWSVFLGNASNFSFVFSEFFYRNLAVFFSSTIISVLILYYLPARIRGVLTAVFTGLGLCLYIQSMFMNEYMGIMNGNEPNWAQHNLWGIVNLLIWGMILFLSILIKMRYPSHLRTLIYLSMAVLGLEFIAVLSQVCSAQKNVWFHKHQSYCDASNQFQFSKKKNILVFIFDALSVDFVKECFESDPSLKDAMKDFTWYEDALSNYNLTFVALPHELTGSMIHPTNNQQELYHDLWNSVSAKSFYKQIENAGYDSRMYVKVANCIGDYDIFEDYFSNIKKVETAYEVNYSKLCRCLFQISGYSSAPYLFKKFFYYGDDFSNDVVKQYVNSNSAKSAVPVVNTNDRLYNKLNSEGITTDANLPVLSFHYTRGAHRPWRVDEKCQLHEELFDSYLPPTKSCFYLIAKLIRHLKDNQIYDQTTIIICSDHGHFSIAGCSTDYWAMTFMVKPFSANNQEITVDDSKLQSIDILPTVLQLACEEKADFTCFEGFPPSAIPTDRQRIEYEGIFNENLEDYVGIDGNNYNYNGFREYYVDKNNSRKKEFQRIVPLKANTKKNNCYK